MGAIRYVVPSRPHRAPSWLLRLLLLGGAALAVLAVLSGAPGSQAQAAGSCSIYWTGVSTGSWNAAANWSLSDGGGPAGRAPVPTDVVCMSSAPSRSAVTYVSLGRTIAGIDFSATGSVTPSLTLAGGTLSIGSGSGSVDSTINNVALLSGAMLGGTADVLLTGNPSLTDDAILDGPGTTTLAAGTAVSTRGLILDNGRRLLNRGSLTHAGCYDYVYLYDGSVLENAGTFTAATDCGLLVYSDGSPGTTVRNDVGATFAVDQTAADTYDLNADLDNNGTVTVDQGTLAVVPTAGATGSYTLPGSTRLIVAAGGTLTVGIGTVTGSGTVVVQGGVVDVAAGTTLRKLDLQGGSVTGSPTVTTLTGGAGTTFTGGGTLTIPPGGTAVLDNLVVDRGSRLLNQGSFTHAGCGGPIRLQGGSILENAGTFDAATSCAESIDGDGSPGAGVRNDEGGLLTVNQATGYAVYGIDPEVDNDGVIEVVRGHLALGSLSNLVGGRLTGGSYLATSGTLEFPGGVTTNTATIRLGPDGSLDDPRGNAALAALASNTGTLTLDRSLTVGVAMQNSGTVTVTAGALQVAAYTQTAGLTTIGSGGTLRGANGNNSVVIDGGTLTGAGTVANLAGEGTVRPPVGAALTVSYTYAPAARGTLAVSISGPGNPGVGRLVAGTALLDGTLAITTAPGFQPAVGTTYQIVSSTTHPRSGTFAAVTGQGLAGGNYYDVSYGDNAVTLTVRALPGLGVSDAAAAVGDAGSTPMDFAVTLDAASSQDVTVDYTTVNGSAVAGRDYQAAAGTLRFPAGTTTLPLTITILQDSGPEPTETFSLVLSNPTNARLTKDSGTGTIRHQDGAPTAPTVTGLTPNSLGLGAYNQILTVHGGNFVPGSAVTLSGSGVRLVSTQYVDAATLTVTLSAPTSTPLGARDVTVTNPGIGSDTCRGCLTVTATPTVTGAGPSLGTGAVERTVTVSGTNFAAGATVRFTGHTGVSVVSTTVSSPTRIQVSVSVNRSAATGAYDVTVINRDGGKATCQRCFTVLAGPSIAGITPSSVARGTTRSVTIGGSGFATGAVLTPPTGVSFDNVRVVNSTTITATMSVSATRPPGGSQPITVTNPAAAGYGVDTCRCLQIT